jgi:serine phosphatase RsbU (regulator of sigma subunit)
MAFARSSLPVPAEAEDIGHYLVMIEGGEIGRRVLLGAAPVTIGRDAARDLVLVDPDVSRLHLQVSLQRDRVFVEDKNSTNGTFIDGQRIATAVLSEGSLLQVGSHVLRLERRSKREVARSEELARDLAKASQYVHSLLPTPLSEGPVRTDWSFQPSAQLGGDAFGCDQIDADTFVFYMIDVSGHGVGAAMHSVSVLNVLRQRALPDTDPRDPAKVLAGLNSMFQMDRHDGMFLTMWYGVYHVGRRLLRYGCAGHHPGYLVPADRTSALPLKTPGLMIGAAPDVAYRSAEIDVAAGSSLYLFSDGVFEIVTKDQRQWRLGDFVPLVTAAPDEAVSESRRLQRAVQSAARPGPLDDDFSLLVVTFP